MVDLGDAISRARRGDETAFAALFREFQPAMLRYLRGAARTTAEDLASEVWIDVVRGLGSFRGDATSFPAWLFTIAHRRVIDGRRNQALRYETLMSVVPDSQAVPDAASDAEQRMSMDDAVGLIGSLPPDQAEVVLLRVVAGLDVSTVASIVGRRPGTVRVLSHRGMQRLARVVAERSSDRDDAARTAKEEV